MVGSVPAAIQSKFNLINAPAGGFELLHSLGVGVPWDRIGAEDLTWDDVDLYYRLQAAVPF